MNVSEEAVHVSLFPVERCSEGVINKADRVLLAIVGDGYGGCLFNIGEYHFRK